MQRVILATLCATLSASCAPGRPVVTLPPANLLTCSAEPVAPELPGPGIERDQLVLGYVLGLRSAWADCASKLAGVDAWAKSLAE